MARVRAVRVAAASLNEIPLDWEHNKNLIIKALQKAKDQRASVLCFPELCISGYNCEDMFHAAHVHETSLKVLSEILPYTRDIVAALTLPLSFRGAVYNVVAMCVDGEILGFTAKQNLASEGVHYEPRWFRPWPKNKQVEITIFGKRYPLGDLMYDVGGLRIGFEICQDAWVASRTGVSLAERGVDIILNCSASHFAFGKFHVRKRFVTEACRAFGVAYIYTNCLGNSAGRIIYDGEALIARGDEFLAQGPRFSFQDLQMSFANLDIESLRMRRARSNIVADAAITESELEIRGEFNFPKLEITQSTKELNIPAWETSEELKAEEFSRSVALGLFDYIRKSKTKGFVVNLSGGADSAATACLVYLMVRFGVNELGLDGFKQKLDYFTEIQDLDSIEAIMPKMLYCLYQSSDFSSDTTRKAATSLAAALNATFYEYPMQPIVQTYLSEMADITGEVLDWEQHDLALQNIQARVRGPGAWLLANMKGAVLLSTGNRSEAAVGYTTMDGDTCGGISPIGGIDKQYLLQWLRWLETTGPVDVGPIPALKYVNAHPPSAELRPVEKRQTDEKDLMPYNLLAAIERKAIHDKKSPVQVYHSLKEEVEVESNELIDRIIQFFSLWAKNQWKRERYAPSFHLDDSNLDPKSWCRFPILSGGFKRELQLLEKFRV